MAVVASATEVVTEQGEDWHPLRRVAFRFALLYWLLYHLPTPLDYIPGFVGWVTQCHDRIWQTLVPWAGEHVLHLPDAVAYTSTGSGDTTYHYVQLFCILVIASLGTLLWSLLARRGAYASLADGLRTYLRYVLSVAMFSYGFAKVFPSQFPPPMLTQLIETYGDSSPMGLLWVFMGASLPYTMFGGAMEVLGGLLLLWRRTATLGALILVPVLVNVVMMNVCYDVPVKLYSSHLLLMAVCLLLPDLGRLLDLLVWHRPTYPPPLEPPVGSVLRRRGVGVAKALVVACLVGLTFVSNMGPGPRRHPDHIHAFYGIYEIEGVTGNADGTEPLLGDLQRWHRVVFDEWGNLTVQDDRGRLTGFGTTHNDAAHTIRLTGHGGKRQGDMTFAYTRSADGRLTIRGRAAQATLAITLKRQKESRLVSRGFHWINERPY